MGEQLIEIILKMRTWLAPLIPRPLVHLSGVLIGRLLYCLLKERRRVVSTNLEACFGLASQETAILTRRFFRHLGIVLSEILLTPYVTWRFLQRYVTIEGQEYLDQAVQAGRGVIIFTGHFGNWELLGAILTRMGYRLNVIARHQNNELGDRVLSRVREQYQLNVFRRGMSIRAAYKTLKQGEILVLLGDQEARKSGWFVNFFGRPASTFPGPVQLAQKTGAEIVPVFLAREGIGKHRVIVRPGMTVPPDASEAELHAYLQKLTEILEETIRLYPEQWFWVHRRWKSQPPEYEGESLYADNPRV